MNDAAPLNILWTDGLSVGHASLDAEHRVFVELLSWLAQGISDPRRWEDSMAITQAITDATLPHFAHEEVVLRKYHFPGTEAHCQEHVRLAEAIGQLCGLTARALTYDARRQHVIDLADALLSHFIGSDMLFKSFLINAMEEERVRQGSGPTRGAPPCPADPDCPGCRPSGILDPVSLKSEARIAWPPSPRTGGTTSLADRSSAPLWGRVA